MRIRSNLFWLIIAVMLVAAGALTYVRWVSPESGLAIRLIAAAPYALLIYLAAVLLFGVRRCFGRYAGRHLVVLPLAGLLLHSWWLAPLFTGPIPAASPDSPTIRLLTINVWSFGADPQTLVDLVRQERVDVLVVVEAPADYQSQLAQAGVEPLLPYVDAGQGDGGAQKVFSRWPIKRVSTLDQTASSTPLVDLMLPHSRRLRLLAIHPWSPMGDASEWLSDYRTLADTPWTDQVDVIAGDFNATLDHLPLRRWSDRGWRDVTELANLGWQPTWPADGQVRVGGVPVPRLIQIDHVFVGPRMTAKSGRPITVPGSDHAGYLAELAWRSGAGR